MKEIFEELIASGISTTINIRDGYIYAAFSSVEISLLGYLHIFNTDELISLLSNVELIADEIRKDGERKGFESKVDALRKAGYTITGPEVKE